MDFFFCFEYQWTVRRFCVSVWLLCRRRLPRPGRWAGRWAGRTARGVGGVVFGVPRSFCIAGHPTGVYKDKIMVFLITKTDRHT